MDQLVKKMENLRKPILTITGAIDHKKGDAEKSIKNFLSSDVGIAYLASSMEIETSDIDDLDQKIKSELLEESADGYVVRQDRHEEVETLTKELLRRSRKLRRQMRVIDSQLGEAAAKQFKQLTGSTLSNLLLAEKVKQYVEGKKFDAWPVWIAEHFAMKDGCYVLRDEARELLEHLQEESSQIQEQLANDDF
jgi:hypothetical protein